MGIVNVTPDSFSDGGKFADADRAIAHGKQLAEEGADFLDVGGESTRPGAEPLSAEEEQRRILPVIAALAKAVKIPVSVDTYKSAVADAALTEGAEIVNDISAMTMDPAIVQTVRRHDAAAILMHMKGMPRTMQKEPQYANVVQEVSEYLAERSNAVREAGVRSVIIDPGIGFGKTLAHNIALLKHLEQIVAVGCPVLVGPSRKSFIGTILDLPVQERLEGTAAAVAFAVMNGAHIVRVHDVQHMTRVVRVIDALARG
jgi:dihydropteroate synthase